MTQTTNTITALDYTSSMPKAFTYGSQVVSIRSIKSDGTIIQVGVKGIIVDALMPTKGAIRVHFETGDLMDFYFPSLVLDVTIQQAVEA